MITCRKILPAGAWDPSSAVDRVLLDFDGRHRRRTRLTTDSGHDVLLDLPHAVRLRHGDGLVLGTGGAIAVEARPEPVIDIHADDPTTLVRIAWHLGNRHLPVQLTGHCLRVRADHVIAEMVRGLGGHVVAGEAPFDPEPGAYAGAGGSHHEQHPADG